MTPRELFETMLDGYAEGTLDPDGARTMEALLAERPDWREEAERERALVQSMRAMAAVRAPAGLATAVLQQVAPVEAPAEQDDQDAEADEVVEDDEEEDSGRVVPMERRPHRPVFTWVAAAMIMIGAGISYMTSEKRDPVLPGTQEFKREAQVVALDTTRPAREVGPPSISAFRSKDGPAGDVADALEDWDEDGLAAPPLDKGVAEAEALAETYPSSIAMAELRVRGVDPSVDSAGREEQFAAMSQRGSFHPPAPAEAVAGGGASAANEIQPEEDARLDRATGFVVPEEMAHLDPFLELYEPGAFGRTVASSDETVGSDAREVTFDDRAKANAFIALNNGIVLRDAPEADNKRLAMVSLPEGNAMAGTVNVFYRMGADAQGDGKESGARQRTAGDAPKLAAASEPALAAAAGPAKTREQAASSPKPDAAPLPATLEQWMASRGATPAPQPGGALHVLFPSNEGAVAAFNEGLGPDFALNYNITPERLVFDANGPQPMLVILPPAE